MVLACTRQISHGRYRCYYIIHCLPSHLYLVAHVIALILTTLCEPCRHDIIATRGVVPVATQRPPSRCWAALSCLSSLVAVGSATALGSPTVALVASVPTMAAAAVVERRSIGPRTAQRHQLPSPVGEEVPVVQPTTTRVCYCRHDGSTAPALFPDPRPPMCRLYCASDVMIIDHCFGTLGIDGGCVQGLEAATRHKAPSRRVGPAEVKPTMASAAIGPRRLSTSGHW